MKTLLGLMEDEILSDLKMEADKLQSSSISQATRKNYVSDFFSFRFWCLKHKLEYSPASVETLLLYLTAIRKKKKYSTISRAVTGIHRIYCLSGMKSPAADPAVKDLLRGIRRELGISTHQTKPIDWKSLVKMVHAELPSMHGLRNRAILMLGWCGAFRRSELVSVNIEDIERIDEGLVITIHRSKTDQEGKGKKIFIPSAPEFSAACPVKTLFQYLDRMARKTGPLFTAAPKRRQDFWDTGSEGRLSDQSITRVVKLAAGRIGLNPVHYSSHSLRRGFASEAGRLGIPERLIARQTRHRSMSVLRRYIDDGSLTTNNPLLFIYSRQSLRPLPTKSADPREKENKAQEPPAPSVDDQGTAFDFVALEVPFQNLVE